MLKPKLGNDRRHWESIGDEQLADMDLEIDAPDTLPGIVTEIPVDHEEAYIEFTYDLRGSGREEEFVCVHGHHRHLHGAVMRVGDVRFLVGWICAEAIYGERLAGYQADYDAAVTRRSAVVRVRQLREAIVEFSAWASEVSRSGALQSYDGVRARLKSGFPFVYETLRGAAGRRIAGAIMPRNLCTDGGDIEDSFGRLMKEIARVATSLTGDAQRVANSIGSIRLNIEGLVRRADVAVDKLADVELFFQPSTLAAICSHAANAVPRRANHYAGLLKLTCRNRVIEMPKGFVVPSRTAIDRLRAALAG